jgi:hypothetical protein
MKEKASRSAFYAEACKCDYITEDLQENYFQKSGFDDLN